MARPPNNNPRRRRGRRPNGKGNGSVDSSGPSVKVRGSAKQVYDKYLILARDAKSSGDSILSESYFQHAEHYARILIENGKFDTTSSANGDAKNKNHSIKDAKNSDNESIEKESNIDESQKLQNDETLAAKIEDTPLKEENI